MKAAAISTEIKIDHFLIFFVACRARKTAEAVAEAFGSRRSLSMIWSRSLCVPRMARRRTCETADCRPDVKWGCAHRVVKRSPLFYDSVVKDQFGSATGTPEGFGADWRFRSNLASPPITCPLIYSRQNTHFDNIFSLQIAQNVHFTLILWG